jgi:predicted transcriptional regulator
MAGHRREKRDKYTVSVTLRPETLTSADAFAKALGLNRSQLFELAITSFIKRESEAPRKEIV